MGVHVAAARPGSTPASFSALSDRARRAAAAGVGRGDVEGIGAGAVAEQLAERLGAARLGHLGGLEHEHGRALAHHEAVAPRVERARDAGLRQRAHRVERGERQRGDAGLGAAGHGGVRVTGADHAQRRADRVGAGRAGRNRAVRRALQPVAHRQRGGPGVGHHERDRKRRDAAGAGLAQHVMHGSRSSDPAYAGADDRGHTLGVDRQPVGPTGLRIASSPAKITSCEKRSLRRCSFLESRSPGSKSEQRARPSSIADSPAAQRSYSRLAPTPSGVTAPTPVMTTRRLMTPGSPPGRSRRQRSSAAPCPRP